MDKFEQMLNIWVKFQFSIMKKDLAQEKSGWYNVAMYGILD